MELWARKGEKSCAATRPVCRSCSAICSVRDALVWALSGGSRMVESANLWLSQCSLAPVLKPFAVVRPSSRPPRGANRRFWPPSRWCVPRGYYRSDPLAVTAKTTPLYLQSARLLLLSQRNTRCFREVVSYVFPTCNISFPASIRVAASLLVKLPIDSWTMLISAGSSMLSSWK
jgi:hypothetical protein